MLEALHNGLEARNGSFIIIEFQKLENFKHLMLEPESKLESVTLHGISDGVIVSILLYLLKGPQLTDELVSHRLRLRGVDLSARTPVIDLEWEVEVVHNGSLVAVVYRDDAFVHQELESMLELQSGAVEIREMLQHLRSM